MRALPTQRANEITEVDAHLTVQPLTGHRIKICLVAQINGITVLLPAQDGDSMTIRTPIPPTSGH